MSEWQPIETAPRDGTPVLLHMRDGFVVGQWVRHRAHINCWAWMVLPWPECDFLFAVDPAHWMPLPEPPEAA